MNYKKAVLIVVWATVFFALFIGGLYLIARENDGVSFEQTVQQTDQDQGQVKYEPQDIVGTSSVSQLGSSLYAIDAAGLKGLASSTYIVAFVGDIGINSQSRRVLSLIRSEADAGVILGDFDYEDAPDRWAQMLDEQLGRTFPLIMLIGNHDEIKWSEYLADIKSRLARTPSVNCRGDIGVKSVCAFKDMRLIVTAPGISSLGIESSVYADYIQTEGGKLDDSTWNICAWHKNHRRMQVGTKQDETGWATYEACNKLGFPIITAHEHSYSRSFLFNDVKTQELARHESIALNANAGLKEAKTVDHLKIGPGKTFVTVSGLGGHSIRAQTRNDAWWSTIYTSNQGAKEGVLFCAFNYKGDTGRALCYFKNIDGGVRDVFLVER